MSGNLRVDAIQTPLCPHQRGHANHGLISKHPHLDLRSIDERSGHRGHPRFDKVKMFHGFAGIFNFMFQLEFDRLQTKARDGVPIQSPQKRVLKFAHMESCLAFGQNFMPSVSAPQRMPGKKAKLYRDRADSFGAGPIDS